MECAKPLNPFLKPCMILMKNVLFISYDGMTDPLGQSQVIPYLEGLKKHGYNIFLLSCEKKAPYLRKKTAVKKIMNDAGIHWFPINYSKKPPVLSTLFDLAKLRQAAKSIHLKHRIHLVHTRPGIPALVGYWMKRKFGVKFLNDIRDFYADSRVDGGIWNKSQFIYNVIYRYFKHQEALQVKYSDGIVCLTHAAEAIIQQWPSYNPITPVSVIPCSVDLDLFNPANVNKSEAEKFRSQMGLKTGDFIISYLGSVGGWYLVAEMMRFFKRLLQQIPDAKFLFISPDFHAHVKEIAASYDVPANNVIFAHAERREVPVFLSLSSYSLFFIKPCYSKLSSSPTKHGEIMAMGIPVITNSGVGDLSTIVKKYKSGFVADDFTDASFDGIIHQIEISTFDRNQIRDGAEAYYSLEKAVVAYSVMYDRILRHP